MAHRVAMEKIVAQGHRPLGRHVEHDERSRNYAFDPRRVPAIASVTHTRSIVVLNQGDVGACTGFAMQAAAGTSPLFARIPESNASRPGMDAGTNERQALRLYARATQLDSFRGTYPPTDTGSSGLAVAKAAVEAGLITGYQHAFSIKTAIAALMVGPILIGVNWYDSFDTPAFDGTISISANAQVVGGHEMAVVGYESTGSGTISSADYLKIVNSWGANWGAVGYCRLEVADFERLLAEKGDATVPVPLPAPTPPVPVPVPVPVPTPDEVDRAMWSAVKTWAVTKGLS